MDRTEEEKIAQAGITVILGGREYEIRPLVIRYSGEWRKKSIPLISFLIGYSHKTSEGLEEAITELFTTKTDEMIESFFEYARELNREEIEGIATDGDILLAFMEVFNAFVAPLSVTPPKETLRSEQSLSSS